MRRSAATATATTTRCDAAASDAGHVDEEISHALVVISLREAIADLLLLRFGRLDAVVIADPEPLALVVRDADETVSGRILIGGAAVIHEAAQRVHVRVPALLHARDVLDAPLLV